MPFSSNPLMAPVFQSPVGDRRDHKPPVVSIKRAEDSMESGIRLHHNQAREGYILQPEVEGLGVAPVEVQTAALASGGSVARHTRLAEGDVFLPITLVSPVPSALPGMFDALVDIVRPGQRDENGLPLQFEVVVLDPYGQETRSRRLIFESGLDDPVRVNHHIWRTSITGRFVDPYWYGQVRELRRRLGQMEKKFITAKQGPPDPEAPPPITYEWEGEPHASTSVKKVDGEIVARNLVINGDFENGIHGWTVSGGSGSEHSQFNKQMWGGLGGHMLQVSHAGAGVFTIAHQDIPIQPGQWVAVAYYAATDPDVKHQTEFYWYADSALVGSDTSDWRDDLGWYAGGRMMVAFQAPDTADTLQLRLPIRVPDGTSARRAWFDKVIVAEAATESEALAQVETFFDGSTRDVTPQIGGYEFPFFPVRIGGSVVQGEYELQVEGDAPAYWSGVITPPGEDLLIQNAKGERIFVKGRVDEPILIQTRPQEQDITLADGTPIWDRIDPGDDDFFPLHPGKNTVHVSMVGATQQSEILIRYREAFFHAIGGGR